MSLQQSMVPEARAKAAAASSFLAQGGPQFKLSRRFKTGRLRGKTMEQAQAQFEEMWAKAPDAVKEKYASRSMTDFAPSERKFYEQQGSLVGGRAVPAPFSRVHAGGMVGTDEERARVASMIEAGSGFATADTGDGAMKAAVAMKGSGMTQADFERRGGFGGWLKSKFAVSPNEQIAQKQAAEFNPHATKPAVAATTIVANPPPGAPPVPVAPAVAGGIAQGPPAPIDPSASGGGRNPRRAPGGAAVKAATMNDPEAAAKVVESARKKAEAPAATTEQKAAYAKWQEVTGKKAAEQRKKISAIGPSPAGMELVGMKGGKPVYESMDSVYGPAEKPAAEEFRPPMLQTPPMLQAQPATDDQRRADYQARMQQPKIAAARPAFVRGPASQPEMVSPRDVRPAYDEAAAVAKIRQSFVPKARITDEQATAQGYGQAAFDPRYDQLKVGGRGPSGGRIVGIRPGR